MKLCSFWGTKLKADPLLLNSTACPVYALSGDIVHTAVNALRGCCRRNNFDHFRAIGFDYFWGTVSPVSD